MSLQTNFELINNPELFNITLEFDLTQFSF